MSNEFEHGYAVIVGVDENQIGRLALETVAKDVQFLYDVLVHPERCAYKPDNVKLLKGAESTNKNILDALYWLQDKVKADPEATAIVYYSGHGMVDKAANQYYLIPYDIKALSRIRADAIKAESLTAEISGIPAKRMLVILDCCHAAGMAVKSVDVSDLDGGQNIVAMPFPVDQPETKDIPDYTAEPGGKNVIDLLEGEGRAVLNSSTGSQSSYVRTDGAMSLFTYHLIEALTGHAPHPNDATVVYVTDVMSWVTHQVKKSAREQNRDQTPVMRTSGVFPIAQLIGGQGVSKGMGQLPPSPLAPLPPASTTHVEGSMVSGSVDTGGGDFSGRDMVKKEGGVHIDGGFNMSGGSFVGGDNKVVHGDEVHGDKVGGDKVGGDKISVGNISGGQGIAIGREARADVRIQHGPSIDELTPLFAPLLQQVARENATAVAQVKALQTEAARGEEADDEKMADLIETIAAAAPSAIEAIVNLFTNSIVAKAVGGATNYILKRLRK